MNEQAEKKLIILKFNLFGEMMDDFVPDQERNGQNFYKIIFLRSIVFD